MICLEKGVKFNMNTKVKLDSLTGIRFFAAAFIVIGHAHNTFGSAGLATTLALHQGVSIFFILSGFILTYSYPSLMNKKEVGKFLLARFARIWPLHIAAILLLIILVPPESGGYLSFKYKYFIIIANMFLIQAWIPLKNVILSLNRVAWSISTEMVFYLSFPLLLLRWKENWVSKIILVFALLVVFILIGNYFQLINDDTYTGISLFGVVYTNPLARLFEFTIGIATCFLYRKILFLGEELKIVEATFLEAICLFMAVASMWLTPIIAYSPAVIKVIGMAGGRWFASSGSFLPFALLIVMIAFQKGLISRFLGKPIMVLLGEISFATYLIHSVILQFYNNSNAMFSQVSPAIGYVIYWMAVLIVSYLLYIGIEQPCRRWIVGLPHRLKIGNLSNTRVSVDRNFSWQESKSIYGVLLLVVIVLGLKFGLPSIVGGIDKISITEANQITGESLWAEQSGAQFGDDFILMAVDIKPTSNDYYELQFLWQAKKDVQLKYRVGVHLLGEQDQIVDQKDYLQNQNRISVKKGTIWREKINVSRESLQKAKGIAMAMYERPDAMHFLLPVIATNTDWDGHRLVIRDFKML